MNNHCVTLPSLVIVKNFFNKIFEHPIMLSVHFHKRQKNEALLAGGLTPKKLFLVIDKSDYFPLLLLMWTFVLPALDDLKNGLISFEEVQHFIAFMTLNSDTQVIYI